MPSFPNGTFVIYTGLPWSGQSPTRPDPNVYRRPDGADYIQLVYEINTNSGGASGLIVLSLPIDGLAAPGTPVYLETTGHVTAAKADSLVTTNVLGLINSDGKIQVNGTLTLTTLQWDFITGGSGGLNIGTWYWLSDKNAGKLVTIEPEVLGHYSVGLVYALSTTEALILINAPDFIVESLLVSIVDVVSITDNATTASITRTSAADSLTIVDSCLELHVLIEDISSILTIIDTATAVDFPPSFIYFEDFATSKISQSNFDGSSITAITTDLQQSVIKLGADPINNLVFWISDASAQLGTVESRLGGIRLGIIPFVLRYVPFAGGISTVSTISALGVDGFVLDYNTRWIYQYSMTGLWLNHYNADGTAAAQNGNPFVASGMPTGLAIDLVNTFAGFSPVVYLGDMGIPGVVRASVNYADLTTLHGNTTVYTPSGTLGVMACDDMNGTLFVMDGTKLMRMGLTGFNPTLVVNVGSIVNALFVDKSRQKVYYEYGNKVVQSNYDGTGAITVLTNTNTANVNSGYGMAP